MAEIPTPTTGYSAPSGDRPLGVTILAVLEIIVGLLGLFSGFTLLTLGSLMPFGLGAFAAIIGAVVLLSSAALAVSFVWLRKKPANAMVKHR